MGCAGTSPNRNKSAETRRDKKNKERNGCKKNKKRAGRWEGESRRRGNVITKTNSFWKVSKKMKWFQSPVWCQDCTGEEVRAVREWSTTAFRTHIPEKGHTCCHSQVPCLLFCSHPGGQTDISSLKLIALNQSYKNCIYFRNEIGGVK